MDKTLKESIDKLHEHVIGLSRSIFRDLIEEGSLDPGLAHELLLSAGQLISLTPDVSRPTWLDSLVDFHGKELRSRFPGSSAADFSRFIVASISDIESPILSPEEVAFDFDRAFDDLRESEQLSESFETLVEKLEQIIALDVIDSRVVQETLERLMALIRRNKHGSLTSILVSLHYGRFALKAFDGVLSANKHLKPIVAAFKEEFGIAEAKVRAAEEKLKVEAVKLLTNEERLRQYLSQHGFDSSDVSGLLTTADAERDAT
ncbi:hypothetical protein [Roseiconus lacunae]|uniref:Uncharacterized protein n=1 Tax=Roseiconus lacunae TaxID=2605694 RepID=A0ABT7PI31_9BACT|nr:hypothetical protein [Roseiconus lacunae]MDM4015983.1 hypothetical protein [Roseiconus lacunae]